MTSTNDGKDVKNIPSSAPKNKTYYIELYKSLEAALTAAVPVCERTQEVCRAWSRVHCLCLHSVDDTHPHLLTWLQRHTVSLLLLTEWQSPAHSTQRLDLDNALSAFLTEAATAAADRGGPLPWEEALSARANWLRLVLHEPWSHPVLRRLINSQDEGPQLTREEVIEWLKQEQGLMFTCRLRQLAQSKKTDDLALTLATAVMMLVRESAVPGSADQQTELGVKQSSLYCTLLAHSPLCFPDECWDLLVDIELVLLHKRDDRARCIELAKQLPLADGTRLVGRLGRRRDTSPRDKRLWRNAPDVAELVATVMIARCMVAPACVADAYSSLFFCARELARLLPAARLRRAVPALAAPAATAKHLIVLARACGSLLAESQETQQLKPFVCELFVRAITAGMNELERLKLKTETEERSSGTSGQSRAQCEQCGVLARWFHELGALLGSSVRLAGECALTAFSVQPTMHNLELLRALPRLPQIQEKPEPEEPATERGWANDSHSLTNFVKTSETLNMKDTDRQSNVLSTAILTEGEALGLSADLCQDLAVLLSGPRVKTLSFTMDRDKLLALCLSLVQHTRGGTRSAALSTALLHLNLDPASYKHLPEEDDGENDPHYGIEKGYEHLVELPDPEPEEIWAPFYNPYPSTEETDSWSDDYSETQWQKKSSQTLEDADDPLSLAVIKERKDRHRSKERHSKEMNHSKERYNSKERSIDKKKSKDKDASTSRERRKDKPHKPKKESKKKKNIPDSSDSEVKRSEDTGALSSLIGLKICGTSGENLSDEVLRTHHKREKKPKHKPADSDIESQGKSPLASTSIDGAEETNVIFDGLFDVEDTKTVSLMKPSLYAPNIFGTYTPKQSPMEHPNQIGYPDTTKMNNPPAVVNKAQTTRLEMPRPDSRNSLLQHTSFDNPAADETRKRISELMMFRKNKSGNRSPSSPNKRQDFVDTSEPDKQTISAARYQMIDKSPLDYIKNNCLQVQLNVIKPIQYTAKTNSQAAMPPSQVMQQKQESVIKHAPRPNTHSQIATGKQIIGMKDFLNEIQGSLYSNKNEVSITRAPNKGSAKTASANTTIPVKFESNANPATSTSHCAKSSTVDNAPNTFARRSYMHKTKAEKKQVPDNQTQLADYVTMELERHIRLQKMQKAQMLSRDAVSGRLNTPQLYDTTVNKVPNAFTENKICVNSNPVLADILKSPPKDPPNMLYQQNFPNFEASCRVTPSPAGSRVDNQYHNELQNLVQQRNKLNAVSSFTDYQNFSINQQLQGQTLVANQPNTKMPNCQINQPLAATETSPYIQNQEHNVLPSPKLGNQSISTAIPTNAGVETIMQITQPNAAAMAVQTVTTSQVANNNLFNIKVPEGFQDWNSIFDDLKAHKTPSRGPTALDIVLKKNYSKKQSQSILRSQRKPKMQPVEIPEGSQRVVSENKLIPASLVSAAMSNQLSIKAVSASSHTKDVKPKPKREKGATKKRASSTNVKSILKQNAAAENSNTQTAKHKLALPIDVSKKPLTSMPKRTNYPVHTVQEQPEPQTDELLDEYIDEDLLKEIDEVPSDEEIFNPSELTSSKNPIEGPVNSLKPSVVASNPLLLDRNTPVSNTRQCIGMRVIKLNKNVCKSKPIITQTRPAPQQSYMNNSSRHNKPVQETALQTQTRPAPQQSYMNNSSRHNKPVQETALQTQTRPAPQQSYMNNSSRHNKPVQETALQTQTKPASQQSYMNNSSRHNKPVQETALQPVNGPSYDCTIQNANMVVKSTMTTADAANLLVTSMPIARTTPSVVIFNPTIAIPTLQAQIYAPYVNQNTFVAVNPTPITIYRSAQYATPLVNQAIAENTDVVANQEVYRIVNEETNSYAPLQTTVPHVIHANVHDPSNNVTEKPEQKMSNKKITILQETIIKVAAKPLDKPEKRDILAEAIETSEVSEMDVQQNNESVFIEKSVICAPDDIIDTESEQDYLKLDIERIQMKRDAIINRTQHTCAKHPTISLPYAPLSFYDSKPAKQKSTKNSMKVATSTTFVDVPDEVVKSIEKTELLKDVIPAKETAEESSKENSIEENKTRRIFLRSSNKISPPPLLRKKDSGKKSKVRLIYKDENKEEKTVVHTINKNVSPVRVSKRIRSRKSVKANLKETKDILKPIVSELSEKFDLFDIEEALLGCSIKKRTPSAVEKRTPNLVGPETISTTQPILSSQKPEVSERISRESVTDARSVPKITESVSDGISDHEEKTEFTNSEMEVNEDVATVAKDDKKSEDKEDIIEKPAPELNEKQSEDKEEIIEKPAPELNEKPAEKSLQNVTKSTSGTEKLVHSTTMEVKRGIDEEDLNSYFKKNIVIDSINTLPKTKDCPAKKIVRVRFQNSRLYKITVFGDVDIDLDLLFENPGIRRVIENELSEKRKYTFTRTHSSTNHTTIKENNIPVTKNVKDDQVETIDLISDEDVLELKSSSFKTEFGMYKCDVSVQYDIIKKHQIKFDQKCSIRLVKHPDSYYTRYIEGKPDAAVECISILESEDETETDKTAEQDSSVTKTSEPSSFKVYNSDNLIDTNVLIPKKPDAAKTVVFRDGPKIAEYAITSQSHVVSNELIFTTHPTLSESVACESTKHETSETLIRPTTDQPNTFESVLTSTIPEKQKIVASEPILTKNLEIVDALLVTSQIHNVHVTQSEVSDKPEVAVRLLEDKQIPIHDTLPVTLEQQETVAIKPVVKENAAIVACPLEAISDIVDSLPATDKSEIIACGPMITKNPVIINAPLVSTQIHAMDASSNKSAIVVNQPKAQSKMVKETASSEKSKITTIQPVASVDSKIGATEDKTPESEVPTISKEAETAEEPSRFKTPRSAIPGDSDILQDLPLSTESVCIEPSVKLNTILATESQTDKAGTDTITEHMASTQETATPVIIHPEIIELDDSSSDELDEILAAPSILDSITLPSIPLTFEPEDKINEFKNLLLSDLGVLNEKSKRTRRLPKKLIGSPETPKAKSSLPRIKKYPSKDPKLCFQPFVKLWRCDRIVEAYSKISNKLIEDTITIDTSDDEEFNLDLSPLSDENERCESPSILSLPTDKIECDKIIPEIPKANNHEGRTSPVTEVFDIISRILFFTKNDLQEGGQQVHHIECDAEWYATKPYISSRTHNVNLESINLEVFNAPSLLSIVLKHCDNNDTLSRLNSLKKDKDEHKTRQLKRKRTSSDEDKNVVIEKLQKTVQENQHIPERHLFPMLTSESESSDNHIATIDDIEYRGTESHKTVISEPNENTSVPETTGIEMADNRVTNLTKDISLYRDMKEITSFGFSVVIKSRKEIIFDEPVLNNDESDTIVKADCEQEIFEIPCESGYANAESSYELKESLDGDKDTEKVDNAIADITDDVESDCVKYSSREKRNIKGEIEKIPEILLDVNNEDPDNKNDLCEEIACVASTPDIKMSASKECSKDILDKFLEVIKQNVPDYKNTESSETVQEAEIIEKSNQKQCETLVQADRQEKLYKDDASEIIGFDCEVSTKLKDSVNEEPESSTVISNDTEIDEIGAETNNIEPSERVDESESIDFEIFEECTTMNDDKVSTELKDSVSEEPEFSTVISNDAEIDKIRAETNNIVPSEKVDESKSIDFEIFEECTPMNDDTSGIILKGIEFEDPIVGKCYVFHPIGDSASETSSVKTSEDIFNDSAESFEIVQVVEEDAEVESVARDSVIVNDTKRSVTETLSEFMDENEELETHSPVDYVERRSLEDCADEDKVKDIIGCNRKMPVQAIEELSTTELKEDQKCDTSISEEPAKEINDCNFKTDSPLNQTTDDAVATRSITEDINEDSKQEMTNSIVGDITENSMNVDTDETDCADKTPRKTYNSSSRKRSISMKEIKIQEKKYRKGKNIDYPKQTIQSIGLLSYNKEYKIILDYIDTIDFSCVRTYHNNIIDVDGAFQNWPTARPIEDNKLNCDDYSENCLFNETAVTPENTQHVKQTLVEEIMSDYTELKPSEEPILNSETNFNMGFGEGSGRVIQNLKEGGVISIFSAATLSDVKQSQPSYKPEGDGDCEADKRRLDSLNNDQRDRINRYLSYIQTKGKVRSFFKKITLELTNSKVQEKAKKSSKDNRGLFANVPGLYTTEFLTPPPLVPIVQVVQVGQLPVSAAAQNPVTCDPRVTQVSDASPSQCSVENSPRSDNNQQIKAEYTELTNADLTLPLQDRNDQDQPITTKEKMMTEQQVIPKAVEIRTELKELLENSDDTNQNNDSSLSDNKQQEPLDYQYENANTNDNLDMTTDMATDELLFNASQHQTVNNEEYMQKLENGSAEKTDQIAHAMNAAGITTSPEAPVTNASPQHPFVNILSQKIIRSSSGPSSNNNYPTTSINAMALQQALASILPSPLNQTNSDNAQQSQATQQVLHIVQGKNASGSQITLVDNSNQSVINTPNTTQVLHIVQNKASGTTNGTPSGQINSFSGLSLVDTGLQQGGNQLLHIVNAGNQKNAQPGQLLKRVNLLTNLTNAQGGNEQKVVQFVCKSADGKSIHLNAPHQRSMVLRLQPIETPNVQQVAKPLENQEDTTPTNNSNTIDAASQQEIKSRSIYEENYAKFIQNSSIKPTTAGEKSTSLPKFNQAFGKPVFQDGAEKQNDMNTNSHLPSGNNTDGAACPQTENTINLEQLGQISSPPLLLRKTSAPTTQGQQNLVQQLKQTIAPMNIQTMHGGVIYTRQIPVNIGGGQTINLITVPSTELIDESSQKQQHNEVKFVNQNEMDGQPSIIKIVPQSQTQSNNEGSTEENTHMGSTNDNSTTQQPQQVLTQMRIKLPMLSKNPQVVPGARVVRPSFFQIQRNVISGNNQPVYQQLVLTAAPPLGQQTIRLPQAQTRQVKLPTESPASESQLSSSTLEQLREFDMVLEQVKERSTVQPNGNVNNTFTKLLTTSTDTTDSPATTASTTSTDTTQQVLYSIGNTSTMSVAYVNRKSTVTTTTTSSYVRSPDSSGIADSPSSSQVVAETSTSSSENQQKAAKIASKHVKTRPSRPSSSTHTPTAMKVNHIPPKTSTQKPLEDEQTTQRILYILAEYKEQVENSPDKDKPAPRRRTNLPPNTGGSSKRKKSSSGSRRPGCTRDHSPSGEDSCRTMGSEDSSCGTSQGDCNESCNLEAHSPQDSPRKIARKLTFEQDQQVITQPRPMPPRNVIVADGQTITVARSATGKPTTAVLMPANYILPMSMMKGGQQIAIVTNRGPKLLTVGGTGEGGAANALLLQRLIGPAGLKPVLTRPGVRHVRLPAAALHNLQAFNLATTTVAPPDSTASPGPAPTPPELVDTRANTSWADRETTSEVKPERVSSPDGSEPWNLRSSADPPDYTYEEPVTSRGDNMDRTVLGPIPGRYSPDLEAQRIFDKMFDVDSKKPYVDGSPRVGYNDIGESHSDEEKYHQVVQKKDGSTHGQQQRFAHISSAALRHKYAILEHELRLQKSLSEECSDLGVDSPSASELFPEAELLFAASPAAHEHAHEHHAHHHAQPTQPLQSHPAPPEVSEHLLAADQGQLNDVNLGLPDGMVTVGEDGTATIALDQEEFARSHPNTTFHSEPTDGAEQVAQVQPFSIAAGLKARHVSSAMFHSNSAPATVLMAAPQQTVISQATGETSGLNNNVKYFDNMIHSLPSAHNNRDVNLSSVLVKDDRLTRFESILTGSREIHLSHTASAIVRAGNTTQVIRRVCYEEDKRDRDRYLMEDSDGLIAGDDAKMAVVEDSSRDATLESIGGDVDGESSPERQNDLFWENSMSERSESRRPLDFSSDSEKCCKSPSLDETNSTDSSGVGTHLRLDSVIKEARSRERSGSADGSSADDTTLPPIRTYPPKRSFQQDSERSVSGKTRAGESPGGEGAVRRRASGRGVVKRGCLCCTGEPAPAPARSKKPRQRKPTLDFTN